MLFIGADLRRVFDGDSPRQRKNFDIWYFDLAQYQSWT